MAAPHQYQDWRKEKDHSDYLKEQEEGFLILSLYSDTINEYGDGEDVIADEKVNVEETAILIAQVTHC